MKQNGTEQTCFSQFWFFSVMISPIESKYSFLGHYVIISMRILFLLAINGNVQQFDESFSDHNIHWINFQKKNKTESQIHTIKTPKLHFQNSNKIKTQQLNSKWENIVNWLFWLLQSDVIPNCHTANKIEQKKKQNCYYRMRSGTNSRRSWMLNFVSFFLLSCERNSNEWTVKWFKISSADLFCH